MPKAADSVERRLETYLIKMLHINQQIDDRLRQVAFLRKEASGKTYVLSGAGQQEIAVLFCIPASVNHSIVELEAAVDADVDRLVDMNNEVRKIMNQVEDPQRRVALTRRFSYLMPHISKHTSL